MSHMSEIDLECQNLGIENPSEQQILLVHAMEVLNKYLSTVAVIQWKNLTQGAPDVPKSYSGREMRDQYQRSHQGMSITPAKPVWVPVVRPRLAGELASIDSAGDSVPYLLLPHGYEVYVRDAGQESGPEYVLLTPGVLAEDRDVDPDHVISSAIRPERLILPYMIEVARLQYETVDGMLDALDYANEHHRNDRLADAILSMGARVSKAIQEDMKGGLNEQFMQTADAQGKAEETGGENPAGSEKDTASGTDKARVRDGVRIHAGHTGTGVEGDTAEGLSKSEEAEEAARRG